MDQSSDIMAIISRQVNIRQLIKNVDFVDESVGNAAKDQPKLFLKAARFYSQKVREKLTAESALEIAKASVGAKIRDEISSGGERATAPAIQEKLVQNKQIQLLEKAFQDSVVIETYAKLIVEAFRQRKSAIDAVIDLMGAELYVQRRSGEQGELSKLKDSLQKKYPGRLVE